MAVVTAVGAASGTRAAAAVLACAGSQPDRAGLLVDLTADRQPRPSLIATSAARQLEERLAVHLPNAGIASRGATCHLTPRIAAGAAVDEAGGLGLLAAVLPLVRDSVGVVNLPPRLLQPVLDDPRTRPSAALLRADLPADRALAALAAHDLIGRGIRVSILKQPPPWLTARRALFGALPSASGGLPTRQVGRLLAPASESR